MPRNRTVAIVGAGRVGRALATRLHKKGWRIGAVVARSPTSARAATRAIGAGQPFAQLNEGILAADVVLIATPDNAIAKVARQLSALGSKGKKEWRNKVVLHTCGALDRTILRPLERQGAQTGALHPLQTFARGRPVDLKGCVCAIEGTPAVLRMARRLCRDLGCIPIRIPQGAKPAYHAAAVFAAGHVFGVVEAATRILMSMGFSRRQAATALLPLTRQTLSNFEHASVPRIGWPVRVAGSRRARGGKAEPAAYWTGPAARGDWKTVSRHLVALKRFPREYREAYAALTRLSIRGLVRNPRALEHRHSLSHRGPR